MPVYYAVLTEGINVKAVKNALEEKHMLNKRIKIEKSPTIGAGSEVLFVVPTNVVATVQTSEEIRRDDPEVARIRSCLGGSGNRLDLTEIEDGAEESSRSPLQASVVKALNEAFTRGCDVLPCSILDLVKALPGSYCLWQPMLLLQEHTFSTEHWRRVVELLRTDPVLKARFYKTLAKGMDVTHIAINAPIPTLNPGLDGGNSDPDENLLRSPTNLQPLHGDFGPLLRPFPHHCPSSNDFASAFWVSTRQNGIRQVWAPRYTMFSAGNVTEKARLLTLPSVVSAVSRGKQTGQGCSAVDLFSGIGYFAFSYVRAGVDRVLCWDLNPWSIEGLRRGAALNKWDTCTVVDESMDDLSPAIEEIGDARLLLFCQSNARASSHIERLRARVPPIRHVNCGMLPAVGQAWKTAVEAVDPELGGLLHLHETVAESNIHKRSEEITKGVREHMLSLEMTEQAAQGVALEHVEKVKSVGPRMLHVVLDIWVPPRRSQ